MQPLTGLRVLEVMGSPAGAYCARLFGVLGADVTVLHDRSQAAELSLPRWQYWHEFASVTSAEGFEASADAPFDVVIESSAPEPLGEQLDVAGDPVRVRISPFAPTGPYATWLGTDLIDYAIGGHAYLYGDPEREPLRGPPDQPAIASGLFGFVGAMAALLADLSGSTVEVDHQRTMVALHQLTLLRWCLTGDVFRRMGNRYTGQGQPNGPYLCRDGWIAITAVTPPQVEALLAVTGLYELLEHPSIDTPLDFQDHPELLEGPLQAWAAEQSVDETVELLQSVRVPACPLRTPGELLDDPQLVARSFFTEHRSDQRLRTAGPPFTIMPAATSGTAATTWNHPGGDNPPLAGLKVLDLARVWAGPLCARILADLGAEVTWVEAPWSRGPQHIPDSMLRASRYFPDDEAGDEPWNRNGHMIKYALGKRSLSIDLDTVEGREAFEHLVPHHHVLLENYSSRVMPQLGLDEQRLHELNPDLVYLTMPGYGRSGPAEHWLAYGSCIDSHAGLSALTGYADATPWKGGMAWPDPVAGLHACSALLATLVAQRRHGQGGATIEAAQFESTVAAIGEHVLAAQLDAALVVTGNDDPAMHRQGVYPTTGDDAWIAISLVDEAMARRAADVLGIEDATSDAALTQATRTRDAVELAAQLQAAGVAAAPVATAPMIMDDPQLRALNFWATVDQPEVGPFVAPHCPITFPTTPEWVDVRSPAPTLGEHNRSVCTEAGVPTETIDALSEAGILTDRPPS